MGRVPEGLQEQTDLKLPTVSLRWSDTAQGRAAGGCKVLQDWGQAEVMATPPQSLAMLPTAPMAAWSHSSAAEQCLPQVWETSAAP